MATLTKITASTPIYRACSGYVGAWSCWSPDRETAEAYLDNPGMGGPTLVEATIGTDYILDLRGQSDSSARHELAEEILAAWNKSLAEEAEMWGRCFTKATVADLLEDWWDCAYLYQVWERCRRTREVLPTLYDVIIHDAETYPEYATTVVRLVD